MVISSIAEQTDLRAVNGIDRRSLQSSQGTDLRSGQSIQLTGGQRNDLIR